MASYKDLLRMIRQGRNPRYIQGRLKMYPSRWRRLLNCKALWKKLKIERSLAAMVVGHQRAAGVNQFVTRLIELMDSGENETARKACVELLDAGLSETSGTADGDDKAKPPADAPPWTLLRKLDPSEREEADRLYRQSREPVDVQPTTQPAAPTLKIGVQNA